MDDLVTRQFKKAMHYKDVLGLTDDERHELAQMIPSVDKDHGGSWKELDHDQLHDLLTMLEGYIYIHFLLENRGWREEEGLTHE